MCSCDMHFLLLISSQVYLCLPCGACMCMCVCVCVWVGGWLLIVVSSVGKCRN